MNRNKLICLVRRWKFQYSVLAAVLLAILFCVAVYVAVKKVPTKDYEESLAVQLFQNSPSPRDGKGKAIVINKIMIRIIMVFILNLPFGFTYPDNQPGFCFIRENNGIAGYTIGLQD